MSEDDRSSSLDWIDWFHSLPGNEFFVEVDLDFIEDRFNLTGLNMEVPNFMLSYKLITDMLTEDLDAKTETQVDRAAKHLYGLIHARYVLTTAGLNKMAERFKRAEFGVCPRALCRHQAVLPLGITDVPGERSVKVYCPNCQDVYSPQSRKYESVDGAYFTTTLPHMLLQCFPQLVPNPRLMERYIPRIYGFKVHEAAKEHRLQDELREVQQQRLGMKQNSQ